MGAVDVVAACMRVHGSNSQIVQEQAWFLLGALGESAALKTSEDLAAVTAAAAS